MNTIRGDSEILDGSEQEMHAALACERCKRRKIKCDRILPACTTCTKITANCTYPIGAQKPGPKTGSSQRRKLRRLHGANIIPNALPRAQRDDTTIRYLRVPATRPTISEATGHDEQDDSNSLQEVSQYNTQTSSNEHGNIPSPATTTGVSEGPVSRGLSLSQLIHPSHEPTSESVTTQLYSIDGGDESAKWRMIVDVCNDLKISVDSYQPLVDAYFTNMTSFSLFHRPSFDQKIFDISTQVQRKALLASMFSFSARFLNHVQHRCNSPEDFHRLAEKLVSEALDECAEDTPTLCILQSMILTTFQQLSNGVRGRAWRSMGTLVRIGYELQLHLIDKNNNCDGAQEFNIQDLSLNEERRRAWWTIWEFDVLASTIRRLPTAIDWSENATWLPINDEIWFSNSFRPSCHLNPDAAFAWKNLEKSGNKSPKAWFIVINALMRSAYFISYHQLHFDTSLCSQTSPRTHNYHQPIVDNAQSMQSQLDILANALCCFCVALPTSLSFQGEVLTFSGSDIPGTPNTLQQDSGKYSIHIMIQLSRFMLYHRQVFSNSSRSEMTGANAPSGTHAVDRGSWNCYLNAAEEIVSIVRNSSVKHVQYVNPFLCNTIWLGATAQVVSRLFGPPRNNPRLAESNLDLLQKNIDAYISFWGISRTLQQKLKAVEMKLDSVLDKDTNLQHPTNRLTTANPGCVLGQAQNVQGSTLSSTPNDVTHGQSTERIACFLDPVAGTETLRQDPWTESRAFDISGHSFALDMPFNLYGFGLDEILTYGALD